MKQICFIQVLLSLLFLIRSAVIYSEDDLKDNLGMNFHLSHPLYQDGVLSTEQGGVISGPDFWIQAKNIKYNCAPFRKDAKSSITAEGDLIVEIGPYLFIGEKLEYDFVSRTGVIHQGRTGNPPWYFGAEKIYLCADGSYSLIKGYITTSESTDLDWDIKTSSAHVNCNRDLQAKNVYFHLFQFPVFYWPSLCANLDTIFDSPFKYFVRWGGRQGPRIGMTYEIFSYGRLKNFLRVDWRLKRGLGGGFETHYLSEDHKHQLDSVNYLARDSSIQDPDQQTRYRFQGAYRSAFQEDRLMVNFSYDKLSDKEMATDYHDKTLLIKKAGRTQLHTRYEDPRWIGNFLTRVRVNNFQTVKQELPTIQTYWKPYDLCSTGIWVDQFMKLSYLDFEYTHINQNVRDFNSSRLEYTLRLYRPIPLGHATLTPEAGFISIFYNNSPQKSPKWLVLSQLASELQTEAWRDYQCFKHVLRPYIRYDYYSWPSVGPDNHYIFDIEDGLFRLNQLSFGMKQYFIKGSNCSLNRSFMLNLYANAFFFTHTIPAAIPKVFAECHYFPISTLRQSLTTAWDFDQGTLDHLNLITEWTLSKNFAVGFEYRHRSRFDWRKVDPSNYFLDSFRSIEELEHSALSDRRDTFLLRLFYHFHPRWGLRFQSRHGWNRITEPAYNEFQCDVIGRFPSAWNVKFSYRHEEDDDRIGMTLTIGLKTPNPDKIASKIIPIEF